MPEDGLLQKIGQCAVGVGKVNSVFLGELQLLSRYSSFWTSAMTALLGHLGPGHYSYGSVQSIEESREEDLKQISAVTIEAFGLWRSTPSISVVGPPGTITGRRSAAIVGATRDALSCLFQICQSRSTRDTKRRATSPRS